MNSPAGLRLEKGVKIIIYFDGAITPDKHILHIWPNITL
jgi:hypothetical protein